MTMPEDFGTPKEGGAAPRPAATPRSISGKMKGEVSYDAAAEVEVEVLDSDLPEADAPEAVAPDGMGCHAPAEQMAAQARASGNGAVLDQFAKDYPQGPHDRPECDVPRVGSLRVGALEDAACGRPNPEAGRPGCVIYGLTICVAFLRCAPLGWVMCRSNSRNAGHRQAVRR